MELTSILIGMDFIYGGIKDPQERVEALKRYADLKGVDYSQMMHLYATYKETGRP